MLYIVDLTIADANFIERMSEMRTWLDHRRVEPSRFRFVIGEAAGACRVHFTSEADAAAFAQEFGGEVSAVAGVTAGAGGVSSRSASSSGSGPARPS
jgi:hypothetical protein